MHKLTVPGNQVAFAFKNSEIIQRNTHYILRVTSKKNYLGQLLIIAPKVVGNAVKRNLIKRRLKSIFYEEQLYEHNRDIIVTCKKDIDKIPYSSLKDQFKNLIVKAINKIK